MNDWSMLRKLIWLHVISGGGSSGARTTVTGVSPLALANALAKPIRSLIQYGKVTTSNGDTYCNNGKLVAVDDELPSGYERQIGFVFAASTYYLISGFYLRGSDTVRFSFSADKACNVFGCYTTNSATDNYSLYASTSNGGKYLRYDGSTYNSYIPSAQIGERLDVVITPTGTTGMPTDSVITPAEFEATADLCIGTTSTSASSSKLDGNIWGKFVVDGRLTLVPCKRLSDDALGYYDLDSDTFYEPIGSAPTSLGVDSSHLTVLSVEGTAEVLTIGEQTATVANLFAVDDIADEQNIISGTVTRRCEAVISDGTTPSGRYIGEVGDGNIIVKARETGYEGDVATFEADSVAPLNGLSVNVEPIQDLHGYDNPWPAGGGKNKFNGANYVSGTLVPVHIAQGTIVTASAKSTASVQLQYYDVNQTQIDYWSMGYNSELNRVTRTFAIINSDCEYIAFVGDDLNDLQVELGSTATPYAPYSNICPISGRTSATVTRTGINIFDKSEVVDNAYINENDGTERSANGSKCTGWISVVPGEKYYILTEQTAGAWGSWYDRNKSYISPITRYLPSGSQKKQTAPSNAAYMRLTCVQNGSGNIDTFSVNYPSTDHDYHPYQGNTYTIQLGDTVYGGTLDVTGGKMVVDRAMVDMGTLNWTYDASKERFRGVLPATSSASQSNPGARTHCLCSIYKPSAEAYSDSSRTYMVVCVNIDYVWLRDNRYTDAATFKAAMSGVQLCYELAQPIEITLTPTQIDMLLGENNLWADAGSVKAYVADAELTEHVTPQPMRTAEGINIVTVTSAVAPVQLSATYTRAET